MAIQVPTKTDRTFNTPKPGAAPVTEAPPVNPAPPAAGASIVPPSKEGKGVEHTGMEAIGKLLWSKEHAIDRLIPKGLNLTSKQLITNLIAYVAQERYCLMCQPSSILFSAMAAAKLGLDFVSGQSFLRVNEAKDRDGGILYRYASYVPGYTGLIQVLARNGWETTSQVRYANDFYEAGMNGAAYFVNWKIADSPRGEMVGAFTVFRRTGEDRIYHLEYMTGDQILKVSGDNWAWSEFPSEMWRKTPVRRGYKYLPKTNDAMSLLVELDNRAAVGKPMDDLFGDGNDPLDGIDEE